MSSVRVQDLYLRYPGADHDAVRDVSFDVAQGELVCLLGPSGCGKTSVLKAIAGLMHPGSGRITLGEHDVTQLAPEASDAVMVFQDALLFPHMSVAENIGFGLRMQHKSRKEIVRRVEEILETVQLAGLGDRRPHELSGGQQQRVALARALILQPQVLLLDEPLSSLDRHLRTELRTFIRDLQKGLGLTTIFVTHDQEEAVLLSDRIAVMFDGQIAQLGAPADYYEHPQDERIARFFGWENFFAAEKRGAALISDFGELSISQRMQERPDGPVRVGIRPEKVSVVHGEEAENLVHTRVLLESYLGTHTRYCVEAGGHRLEFNAPAVERGHTGSLPISLPPEALWIFP